MSVLCSGYSRQCANQIHVNQDKFGGLRAYDSNHSEITLAVVADGVSLGYQGKYASYNTVLWLLEWASQYIPTHEFDIQTIAREIQIQMIKYNHQLNDYSDLHSDKDTCCTVCGVVTDGKQLLIFNAGDSRLYELSVNGQIRCNYNADTIDTDLTLNAVATNGDTEQVITLGHIYIDNVKPVGEYESALQNLGTFDGFYGMESRTVLIEGVSPDINVDRCEIQLNDTTLKNEDGGFVYDESAHTISFTIGKGYTDVKPTLVDKAGNINNLAMVKNVYVGGVFARWWYLFVLGGLAILAIPTGIIIAIIRKKIRPVSF